MKRKKDISSHHSLAGKIGSASRWRGHVKKQTQQVRIYQDDYSILSSLAFYFGSIASAVHCAIVNSGYNHLSVSKVQARSSKEL